MAHTLDELLVPDLIGGIQRTRLHVVLEPQRVTDFMGHDVLKQTPHQIVRQRKRFRTWIERSDLDEVPVANQVHHVVIELNVGFEDFA